MLARLAENLLWAGRYVERAEDTARLLDVTYHGVVETPHQDQRRAWYALLEALGQEEEHERRGTPLDPEHVTRFLVTDRTNPGSIWSAVWLTRENIRSLREQVSTELWEAANLLYLELERRDISREVEEGPYELLNMVKRRCQTLAGVADETMTRGDGWRFLVVGRQVERAIMGTRLLKVHFARLGPDEAVEFHEWRNMLRAASAFEAFGRAGRGVDADAAVEFLLLDAHFPRSVLFCLRAAEAELTWLESSDPTSPSRRALGRVRARLEYGEWTERHGAAEDYLEDLQHDIQQVFDVIVEEFFAPARPSELHHYELP